jgi:hypothetical protein
MPDMFLEQSWDLSTLPFERAGSHGSNSPERSPEPELLRLLGENFISTTSKAKAHAALTFLYLYLRLTRPGRLCVPSRFSPDVCQDVTD